MALDLFNKEEGIKKHPKYKFLEESLLNEKLILNEWVQNFKDRDNDIVQKFKKEFHSPFWEFYLFSLFENLGFEVDFSKNRPDFIIKNPLKMNIEAVVANIKKNGKEEKERTFEDALPKPIWEMENYQEILDESIVRCSNAISSKLEKYKKGYSKCEWVNKEDPFLIAMSSYDQINYGKEYCYPMLALLYGAYYNEGNLIKREDILKPLTESSIEINLFNKPEYKEISAVIFSCTLTLGKLSSLYKSKNNSINTIINIRHDSEFNYFPINKVSVSTPEELGDGIFIFHNPNARKKIPHELFDKLGIVQVYRDENEIKFDGNNLPIVCRYNTNLFFGNKYREKEFIAEVFKEFNPQLRIKKAKVLIRNEKRLKINISGNNLEIELSPNLSEFKELKESIKTLNEGDDVDILVQVDEQEKVKSILKILENK